MMAIATLETQPRNHAYPYLGKVTPTAPSVALSVPFSDLVPDPAVALTWTFSVLRTGDPTGAIAVDWAVAPGGSPIPAGAFVGGVYPAGTATIPAGLTSATASFQTAAGGQPSADQFAALGLLNPSGCTLGSPASAALRLPAKVLPTQDQVSLTCPDTSWTVDAATHDHLVTVVRSNALGTYLAGSQVTLALAGTGSNPIVAADISGGLLAATVVFAAGETSKPYTVTTLAGTAPAADKTGRVAVSAPVGCQLAATGTQVDVAIPHGVVAPPTGVLPPQYTDPNWTGMSASSGSPVGSFNALKTECGALSGKPACKTTYVELAADFNDTGTMALPYKGYVDTSVTPNKIYPLIIRSVLANIGDRNKVNNLAHFRHITMSGASWLWLYGLAVESPVTSGWQGDLGDAINMDGSSDCFITRCWLDSVIGVRTQTAVRPRIGANDLYGTAKAAALDPWTAQLYFEVGGNTWQTQKRAIEPLVYQNFFGDIRAQFVPVDDAAAFYQGEGKAPIVSSFPQYPDTPWDLNVREGWVFNNLFISTKKFLIYYKHAWNVWRNRVVSINTWNWPDSDGKPDGDAFHYIASRGGNITNKKLAASLYPTSGFTPSTATACVKYNSTEGKSGHNDLQGWNHTCEFNDWGGLIVNMWMQCHERADNPPQDGQHSKTLLATSYARLRGCKNGDYQIGSSRGDGRYRFYAPMLDVAWEHEGDGDASASSSWTWETTYVPDSKAPAQKVTYDLSGQSVVWTPAGLNRDKLQVMFTDESTWHTAVAVGAFSKLAATAAARELTTASKNADYTGEFTKGKKGIVAKDANCLVWDYVGKGGGDGGGGGGGTEPANYDLVSDNMTIWWPYDDMPGNLPNSYVSYIAGGGFEIKAFNNGAIHSCMNIWHKKHPPTDKCLFTFYFTLLDSLTVAPNSEGVFALFRIRQKGSAGFPVNPNDWTTANYRPVAPYTYTTPGSDNMVRDRTTGYRHSFANSADTVAASMQFRCRISDGNNNGTDESIQLATPTVPSPVPSTGDSFLFVQGVKYKLEYTRDGSTVSCLKTRVSDSTTQTWTFVDARLGTAGQGVDGWCGFNASLGRWFKVEPVPGVPFCQAVP